VYEAVHATEVDEGTEVHDRADRPLATLALLQVLEELLSALGLRLLQEGAPREHDVVAVAVELDDLRLELLAHEGLEVPDAPQVYERRREEPSQADVEDQPALHDLDHRALDRLARLHDLLDPSPGALVLRPLLGEDQPAFLVLLLEDQGLDPVAHRDDLVRVDVVADRQLFARDHALGLVADVQQDLVAVDLDDLAVDDVAVLEVVERSLQGLDQLFGCQVGLLARLGRLVGDRRLVTHHPVGLLPARRSGTPGRWDVPGRGCGPAGHGHAR
jgi:hypothetical protein